MLRQCLEVLLPFYAALLYQSLSLRSQLHINKAITSRNSSTFDWQRLGRAERQQPSRGTGSKTRILQKDRFIIRAKSIRMRDVILRHVCVVCPQNPGALECPRAAIFWTNGRLWSLRYQYIYLGNSLINFNPTPLSSNYSHTEVAAESNSSLLQKIR